MRGIAEWLGLPNPSRDITRHAVRLAEEAAWRAVEVALRWPLRTAGVLAVAVATPWVSLIGLAYGAGITLCSVGASLILGGSARRERAESLPEIAKASHRQRRFERRWPEAMELAKFARPARSRVAQPLRARLLRQPPPTTIHPRLSKVRMVSPDHLTAVVDTSPTGTPPRDLAKAQGSILAKVRARKMRVTPLEPHLARIDIRWRDPLAQVIRPAQLPKPARPLHAVVGLEENGDGVEINYTLPQMIIGAQGAGKSSQLWATLDALRAAGVPVRLRVYDPKGGTEFSELEDVAHQYERHPAGWAKLIHGTRVAMETRQAMLRKRGMRKIVHFTEAEPLDITIVDEWLMVKQQHAGRSGDKAEADTEHVLSQGRAAGYIVIALTQNGTKEVIGQLAELFPIRICMRVVTDSMVAVALNAPASAYPAHEIPISRPGEGYVAQDGQIVRYRAAHMAAGDIARVVAWLRRARRRAAS